MNVKQLKLSKMAVFCYLVSDDVTRTCALIDPAFDTAKILAEVKRQRLQVTHILNTHGHADHTAGNAAMRVATGAKLLIHRSDAPKLTSLANRSFSRLLGGKGSPAADQLLEHGDIIQIGKCSLQVIHTPGHSSGSICLYAPGHLFTGDTLFVGAVGRTDLPGGDAKTLLESIRTRIYPLPGDTVVWPGHDYGATPFSTVQHEQQTNPYTR